MDALFAAFAHPLGKHYVDAQRIIYMKRECGVYEEVTRVAVCRLLDESPRWLAVRGYHTHALAVLQRAARWNHVALPPRHRLLQIIKDSQDEVSPTPWGRTRHRQARNRNFFLPPPVMHLPNCSWVIMTL